MKKRGYVLLIDAALMVLVCALVIGWDSLAQLLPSCPIKERLGIYCVGCGGTRFVYHLIHGRPWIAFQNNPYLFIFAIYAVISVVAMNVYLITGRKVHSRIVNKKWMWFWIASGVVFFVLRNIPIFPFSCLAPMRFL